MPELPLHFDLKDTKAASSTAPGFVLRTKERNSSRYGEMPGQGEGRVPNFSIRRS